MEANWPEWNKYGRSAVLETIKHVELENWNVIRESPSGESSSIHGTLPETRNMYDQEAVVDDTSHHGAELPRLPTHSSPSISDTPVEHGPSVTPLHKEGIDNTSNKDLRLVKLKGDKNQMETIQYVSVAMYFLSQFAQKIHLMTEPDS